MQIKIWPIITETTISLAKSGWYTFAAPVLTNKYSLKTSISQVFKVDVLDVRTMVVKGKNKRSAKTRRVSRRPDWKKVMVKIKEGQKIALFEVGA